MAVPVSIEITATPVVPGQGSSLQVNVSEDVTAQKGETYTISVSDPNGVLESAVPVSITIGRGTSSGTIPLATNSGVNGTATFSYPAEKLSTTLSVAAPF